MLVTAFIEAMIFLGSDHLQAVILRVVAPLLLENL